ncbi:hypothetical protein [Paenibacillus tepidiphilus]|uniref:hypothetical protein n=1 Tax=Paenibacillus tepidiphilus TaxID=2608683 RepID=UPI001238AE15|nr:hypothetical protein [Paenibacillus tepidiphilus]
MRRTLWVVSLILFSLSVLVGGTRHSLASSPNITAKSVGKVYVGKNSYVEFLDPHLVGWGQSNVLSFKVRLHNGSSSAMDLLRYGITVTAGPGGLSNALRQKNDAATTKVLPQMSKDYAFYAAVPGKTKLAGIKLGVKEWNIDYADFSRAVGSVEISAGYTDTIPAGAAKISLLQNNQIRLSAGEFYSYDTADMKIFTLTYTAESWGTQPVKLPEYSFWLQSDTGELYPLEDGGQEKPQLNPKGKSVYDLSAAVPKSSRSTSFKLLVGSEEEEVNLVFESFGLQTAKSWDKLAVSRQKAYYIRPDEDQLSVSADPVFLADTNLPQMAAGTEITLKNIGKHTVDKPKLAYFLEANRMTYLLNAAGTGEAETLGALEQSTVLASADIPSSLKGYGMNLIIAKVLGTADEPAYKPLLKLPLSKPYEQGQAKADEITKSAVKDGTPYTLDLGNVLGYAEGNKQVVQGTLILTNTGNQRIELPAFKISGITAQSYKYEGELTEAAGTLDLAPKTRLNQVFRIELPKTAPLTSFKVLVEEPVQDNDKLYRPVATFTLPDVSGSRLSGTDWAYFSTGSGDYKLRRKSTWRLPVNGEDALVTEFELYSSGYESAPVPKFKASYSVNRTQVEAEAFILDKVISVSPDRPVSLQVVGKVPYTMNGGEATLLLQQSEDNTAQSIAVFAVPRFDSVGAYAAAETYSLNIAGRESQLQLYQVLVYPGATEDLLEIELIQRGSNSRSTASNPFTGYLQTPDGVYYPLEYGSSSGTAAKYGGVSVQSLSGKVPKGTKPESLKLLLGLAVNGNGVADSAGSAEAYVKPALFTLMEEAKPASGSLYGMNAGPYTLTITNLSAYFTSTYSGSLSFNAVLKRSIAFDHFDEEHKIVIRLENGGEVITQREYGLNTDDTNSFTLIERKVQLDGISTNLTSSYVQVKVYLSYKGELRLIGTQAASLPVSP